MAGLVGKAGNSVSVSLSGVEDTIRALAALPQYISRKYLLRALNRSIKPTKQALTANVAGLGAVTGNLKRAVASRSVLYPSGVAAAVIGFRRTGKARSRKSGGSVNIGADRAFHSHLIEFGTGPRRPLTMFGRELQRSASGRRQRARLDQLGAGDSMRRDYGILSSGPNRGYFMRPDGGMNFLVTISPRGLRQVAGGPALRPLRRAFQSTVSQVQSKLEEELGKALEKAIKEVADLSDSYYGGA